MEKNEIIDAIRSQAERLEQAAIASVDLCIIAKAIAAKDSTVQESVAKYVVGGHAFESMECLATDGHRDHRDVLFSFRDPPNAITLAPTAFVAVVSIPQRRVVQIVDPYIRGEQALSGALPFAVSVPSNAPNVQVDLAQLAPRFEAETRYLASMGVETVNPLASHSPRTCPIGTVDACSRPTSVGSTSPSGSPPRPDDSITDYQSDTVNDMKTDYPVESVQDD